MAPCHVADERLARLDGDPDLQADLVRADPLHDVQGRPDRAFGNVLVRQRKAEQRRNGVADELLDSPPIALDRLAREPDAERLALAGFLTGYRGLTREAYALDLRQFTAWCRARSLGLFTVRRSEIESFARDLEARGRARATVTRRLCPIAGFYKYAIEEELLDHSPAAQVRRPRIDYESHAVALDRNDLGALLVAAGFGTTVEHALISLLALNGLPVSEAAGADIEHLGLERGHRTLTVTRKGGKVVTIPLAPRTARAIDLAIGERTDGPVFLAADGRRDLRLRPRPGRSMSFLLGTDGPAGLQLMDSARAAAFLWA